MRPPITTHVLNLEMGKPAEGIQIQLFQQVEHEWQLLDTAITDADGRVNQWLAGKSCEQGVYRLEFATGNYFEAQKLESLYPSVTIDFNLSETDAHYHIPLLLTRYGYSTYRGS